MHPLIYHSFLFHSLCLKTFHVSPWCQFCWSFRHRHVDTSCSLQPLSVSSDVRNRCDIDDTTVCTLERRSLIILVNTIDLCGTARPLRWITISGEVEVHLLQQAWMQKRAFSSASLPDRADLLGKEQKQLFAVGFPILCLTRLSCFSNIFI